VDETANAHAAVVPIFTASDELGFQEVETSRDVTGILEEKRFGFQVERGVPGLDSTAWVATYAAASQ